MVSFAVGDLVELKSGGPVMTIEAVLVGSDEFKCVWFAGEKVQSFYFAGRALRKAEQNDG